MSTRGASVPKSPSAPKKRRLGSALLLVGVVVALLGLIGYMVTGPYRALSGLQAAIVRGDASALNQYVDFPTLRQNLKLQLSTRANDGVNSIFQNGIASQIAGGIANRVVDATVDSFVTPDGLSRLLTGASFVVSQIPSTPGDSLQSRLENGRRSFESASTFTLTVATASGRDAVIVLTRNGLDWQLTNVRIPAAGP